MCYFLRYAALVCASIVLCCFVTTTSGTTVSYKWVSKTIDGSPCLNTCTNGKCYVDHHLNERECTQDRGAGVPEYYTTRSESNNNHCLSNCARFGGYDFEWCYTSENYDWDYCNSVVRSATEVYGRTIYGEKCVDECAMYYNTPSKCHNANQQYLACSIPAVVPVQSYSNLFTDALRVKRSPVLDKIFSPTLCSPVCLQRYRDGYDGETQDRINNALAPDRYSGGVNNITAFPQGSPYTYVATTNAVNARGDTVLLPLVVRATLRRPAAKPRWAIPRGASRNVRNMYDGRNEGIDTGYIVAFVNGGTRDMFNFVGQTVEVNRGPYKVIEQYIKEWIHFLGYVAMTVVVDYNGTRPNEIAVKLKFFNDEGSIHSDCLDIIITNN